MTWRHHRTNLYPWPERLGAWLIAVLAIAVVYTAGLVPPSDTPSAVLLWLMRAGASALVGLVLWIEYLYWQVRR